jgi:hypothetical protein
VLRCGDRSSDWVRETKVIRFVAFLVLSCLAHVARGEVDGTAYNKGVDAYKAKNYAAATSHWSDSVLVGNIDAASNLAYLLYSGLGIATDKERAIKLW